MEALKTSETLIDKGVVKSKQDRVGKLVDGMFPEVSRSFDLGNGKCVENLSVPVLESSGFDSCSNVKRFDLLSQPMSAGTSSTIGSSSQGDVSMKGISLFVELTGGVVNKVDGVENVGNVNDRVLHGNEVKGNIDVGQEVFKVNVGDFVWVLIKKQRDSWWPGIVCDASSAPKEVANRPTSEGDVLVKCFGSGNYIWCLAYNVKPFVGYFEEIPSQSKARRFIDAYEKAVAELGHRVKTEFTCSCFSKMKVEKLGNIGDLSVSEFKPATFVDNIKDLARDISMPSKIGYVVKQNCLSAFYRSLGHCQIPMHQLKPANGTPSKIKTDESGFCSEIRDRKKSKFLAYPGEYGTEEAKVDIDGGVDLNQTNGQPVKKSGKKRGRKRKEAAVCTSEVLSQLQVAAQDCLFSCACKNFDSVKTFISGFRKHTFKDISTEIPIKMPNHQILPETIPKKVRKKKDKTIVLPTGNNFNLGSLILDFQNAVSLNCEAQSNANKSTEVVAGRSPFFSFGDQPVTGAFPCKLKPIKRKKNVSLNGEAQSNANKSTQEVTGQSPFFSFGYPPATGAPPCNLKPIKSKKDVSLNGEAQSNANKRMEEVTCQSPSFSFGEKPATGAPPCKLKPIIKKKIAESNTSMPNWSYNVSPPPNVNGNVGPFPFHNASVLPNVNRHVNPFPFHNVNALPTVNGHVNSFPFHVIPHIPDIPQRNDMEGLNQFHASHFTNQAVSTPSVFSGNHGEPQLALVPAGLIHEPKKRGRKRKNIYLQANPGSTIIPQLNENELEANNVRRVKKSKEIGVACIDLSYNRVRQDIEEVTVLERHFGVYKMINLLGQLLLITGFSISPVLIQWLISRLLSKVLLASNQWINKLSRVQLRCQI
uniref:uncharacterized protein LOC122580426 isoform X2 n=1 Tax=Erigeron canadensis TaxID=72917 RepID=UPI001CB9B1E9|nr:uncharacterized protein LOC122580426 isoform X2 [Erigeron canadensis]